MNTSLSKLQAKAFISRLRLLKKSLKLESNADLAAFCGTKPRKVQGWMAGSNRPSPEALAEIETYLQQQLVEFDAGMQAIRAFFPAESAKCD